MNQNYTDIGFPEEKILALEQALQSAFGTTQIDSLAVVTGGLSTNRIYTIGINGKAYLLRMLVESNAYTDPIRQFHCMNAAAQAGIAPHVYYSSTDDGLCLMDFIETRPLEETFPSREALLTDMVTWIQAVHALPPFPPLINFLDAVDMMIGQFQASGIIPDAATAEHFRLYAEIQKAYPRHDPDLMPSHNDLNPNNILCDSTRLWFIDWDAAFQNDRYVDLAIVANRFVADDSEEETFLRAYFGDALNGVHRARFFLMRLICHMYYAMVFLNLAASARTPATIFDTNMERPTPQEFRAAFAAGQIQLSTPEGQFVMGKVSINRALYEMLTPRFAESITLMAGSTTL